MIARLSSVCLDGDSLPREREGTEGATHDRDAQANSPLGLRSGPFATGFLHPSRDGPAYARNVRRIYSMSRPTRRSPSSPRPSTRWTKAPTSSPTLLASCKPSRNSLPRRRSGPPSSPLRSRPSRNPSLRRPASRSVSSSASAEYDQPRHIRSTTADLIRGWDRHTSRSHPQLVLGPSPCDRTEDVGLPWPS